MRVVRLGLAVAACASVMALVLGYSGGQDRLRTYPGYDRYAKMRGEIGSSVRRGELQVTWLDGGKSFQFSRDGKNYRYDISKRSAVQAEPTEAPSNPAATGPRTARGINPARGRQFDTAVSPDEKRKAFYRDCNVFISEPDGSNEVAITTEGNAQKRIKYGIASWVYGEELNVREAMWWSPDSTKLAYYRFDETKVKDYYITLKTTEFQDELDVEPYPKAGTDNPVVDLFVFDLKTGRSVQVDVRDGKPFENETVGHYVYSVRWSPDGKELLFNRTNRKQNIMEFCAANPDTGKVRVIIREEWPTSWTTNSPQVHWLDDKRFTWTSERNGYRNFYLYDISGHLINPITSHSFEVANIVRADAKNGLLFYMARSGDNPYKLQLHRVGLDGKNDKRLTDPTLHHSVNLSPDGKHFIDTAEAHDTPPTTRLVDAEGMILDELSKSDSTKFESLGLQKAELFTYMAADGKTQLYGMLMKPSNFDPAKKYPLLVSVYAGPESGAINERFRTPDPVTELGFLVAFFDGRGTNGRGKKFKDEVYLKLGVVEIDDQAAGVRHLRERPYVDGTRVGIYGTSYGGYASAMALLRHPEVFTAACASSPVTDWRHYDTIYTERYMWIPQENKEGYDNGSCMKYVDQLKGRLMLFFGTADNNVHPANSHQLIRALQRAGKSFDLQIGPDVGHAGINHERMLEFFIEWLKPETPKA